MEETKEIEWPREMKNTIDTWGEKTVIADALDKILPKPLIGIIFDYEFSWYVEELFDDEIIQQFNLRRNHLSFNLIDKFSYRSDRQFESLSRELYKKIKGDVELIPDLTTYLDDLKRYLDKPFYSSNVNKITIVIDNSNIIRRDIFPLYGSYCFENLIRSFLQLIEDVANDMSNLFVDSAVSGFACIRSFDIEKGKSEDSLFINMNLREK